MRRRRIALSAGRRGRLLASAALGFAVYAVTPSPIAQQDIAALVLRSFETSGRWAVSMKEGPGGVSALSAPALGEMGATATIHTGDGDIVVEGLDPIVTGSLDAATEVPDEDRIDRSWKGDLPMTVTRPATAPGFSAGSLFQEESRFVPPVPGREPLMAFSRAEAPLSMLALNRFLKPRPAATEVADLQPVPVPTVRPNTTLLTAAGYPLRDFVPADANAAAEAMLAAYAPDRSVVGQDMFDALFQRPKQRPPVPVAVVGPQDHWWAANPLPIAIYSAADQQCLAEAVYFEARSEPYDGQVAVAQVVLNRVKNPAYPDTICDVVYQNKGMRNACQFSFACDTIKDVVRPGPAWDLAQQVAHDITYGGVWLDRIGTATHYHATYVRPNWAGIFKKKAKIGLHVFYQTIYGGWS